MQNIWKSRTTAWAALIALSVCSFASWTAQGQTQTRTRNGGASVAAEFKRLRSLQASLAKIPMEKQTAEPHKSFLKRHEKEIAYSEPAGQWYVRSDAFWNLSEKYRTLPIAEDIAWTAAQNPVPGECEGFINCYVYLETITHGRYISLFPKGRHARQAMGEIVQRLEELAADNSQYDGPTDASDRAELKTSLSKLRTQISRINSPEASKAAGLVLKLERKHN